MIFCWFGRVASARGRTLPAARRPGTLGTRAFVKLDARGFRWVSMDPLMAWNSDDLRLAVVSRRLFPLVLFAPRALVSTLLFGPSGRFGGSCFSTQLSYFCGASVAAVLCVDAEDYNRGFLHIVFLSNGGCLFPIGQLQINLTRAYVRFDVPNSAAKNGAAWLIVFRCSHLFLRVKIACVVRLGSRANPVEHIIAGVGIRAIDFGIPVNSENKAT